MNLPTAEEFAKEHHPMKTYPVDWKVMIEFAKLHCVEQLKAIHEKVKLCDYNEDCSYEDSDDDLPEYLMVDRDSITNAYPLENIK